METPHRLATPAPSQPVSLRVMGSLLDVRLSGCGRCVETDAESVCGSWTRVVGLMRDEFCACVEQGLQSLPRFPPLPPLTYFKGTVQRHEALPQGHRRSGPHNFLLWWGFLFFPQKKKISAVLFRSSAVAVFSQ